MKQTVNFYDFERAFRDHDRYDQFGYTALKALFDHMEEFEEGSGEETELDVIAICCDCSNYKTAAEAAEEMISGWEREEDEEDDDYEARAIEELNDHTTVLPHDNGVVVFSF